MKEQITISPESYQFLQRWIYKESGIALDESKAYLLQSRLSPVLELQGWTSMETLCHQLRSGTPGVSRLVVEAMTTHETLFFRDVAPFEALRKTILPPLIARGQKLAVWSAAASSGQEAYSLAMLLLELGLTREQAAILGTDLSEKVLVRARTGVYGNFEVSRGLTAEMRGKYFEPSGHDWRVKEPVRAMVRFEQFDLRQTLRGHGPFDIVFCRNVLIYFDLPTKEKILLELRRKLKPGGYLVLGAAEGVMASVVSLQRTVFADAVAYQAI